MSARLLRRTALVAALVAPAAGAAPLAAQAPTGERASVWAGLGGAMPLSQPGVDRSAGAMAVLGLDVPVRSTLAVRLELSADAQELATRAGGPLSGDQQHGRLVALARYAPVTLGRLAPYALAGGGVFWQSDRFTLVDLGNPVPDAAYRQTTSQLARGAMLGVGLATDAARTRLFAEARWTRVGGRDGHAADLGLVAGLALPIAR